jgi:hypothetical protein
MVLTNLIIFPEDQDNPRYDPEESQDGGGYNLFTGTVDVNGITTPFTYEVTSCGEFDSRYNIRLGEERSDTFRKMKNFMKRKERKNIYRHQILKHTRREINRKKTFYDGY